jgi:hypothetical protein
MLLSGRNETVESKRVFANMGVNKKSDFRVKFAESRIRGKWNLDDITHAADIDEHLIRAFFSKASAKLANHRRPVLPPFVRLSTRQRDRG